MVANTLRFAACLLLATACAPPNGYADDRLAQALSKLPNVKRVETRIANTKSATTIIHILDWHFVPLDAFAADVDAKGDELAKLHTEHIKNVSAVQAEQVALLTTMLDKLEVSGVFIEGLTKEDMEVFKIISGVVARNEKAGDVEGLQQTILQHGAPGTLYRAGKLKEVLPLDDEAAMKAANPVKGGKVKIDARANEKREDAMVKNLLAKKGVVVVILGGAHDLSDNLKGKAEYVRVTTEAYSKVAKGR